MSECSVIKSLSSRPLQSSASILHSSISARFSSAHATSKVHKYSHSCLFDIILNFIYCQDFQDRYADQPALDSIRVRIHALQNFFNCILYFLLFLSVCRIAVSQVLAAINQTAIEPVLLPDCTTGIESGMIITGMLLVFSSFFI